VSIVMECWQLAIMVEHNRDTMALQYHQRDYTHW